MGRLERRLLAVGDELERILEEERLISDELSYHRSLADDAARDAAVFGDPIERENATVTASDVRRFERQLAKVVDRRQKLEARRARLLDKLDSR